MIRQAIAAYRRLFAHLDWALVSVIGAVVGIGLLNLYSADDSLVAAFEFETPALGILSTQRNRSVVAGPDASAVTRESAFNAKTGFWNFYRDATGAVP